VIHEHYYFLITSLHHYLSNTSKLPTKFDVLSFFDNNTCIVPAKKIKQNQNKRKKEKNNQRDGRFREIERKRKDKQKVEDG